MSQPGGIVMKGDFIELRNELLRSNKLFVDSEFPPNASSLTFSGTAGLESVIWKRPRDLVQNPRFIKAGVSRLDLYQGQLGNCWFIAGTAVVSTLPKLLLRCIPEDQEFDENYAGIFRFNFYWYGKWVEVIIDDMLPTNGWHLIYARNNADPDEFWPSLLEKAYAKLRGNYEALVGGLAQNAMVDLTGGVSERINLADKNSIPKNLFDLILKSYQMNSLMGASINPSNDNLREKENGLIMGHAYSITGVNVIPYRGSDVQLLRLRNPWGHTEWKGDWSDNSEQVRNMSSETRTKLGLDIRDDGEFWIPFIDVLRNFDAIELCHLQPDSLTSHIANDERKHIWEVKMYHGDWIRGLTAGGCIFFQDFYWKNPQFYITLEDPDKTDNRGLCTIIISLTQEEYKYKSKFAIGFDVYTLPNPQKKPLDGQSAPSDALVFRMQSGDYVYNAREVTRRFELEPGTYAVIPSTFKPHEESKFMLRMYTEKPAEGGLLEEDENNIPSSPVKPVVPVEDLFKKHATEEGQIFAKGLVLFLRDLSAFEFGKGIKFSLESCRSLITMKDRTASGSLSFLETVKGWKEIKAYKKIFEQFDKDGSGSVNTYELGKLFGTLGFSVNKQVQIAIVRRYGNRKNEITLVDFLIVIFKLTMMYDIFKQKQSKTGSTDSASFTMSEFLCYTMYC